MGVLEFVVMESQIQNDNSLMKTPIKNEEIAQNSITDDEIPSSNNSEAQDKDSTSVVSDKKLQLSFSVERLLNNVQNASPDEPVNYNTSIEKCCEESNISCCTHPSCIPSNSIQSVLTRSCQISSPLPSETFRKLQQQVPTFPVSTLSFSDYASKCIIRPMALRALSGNNCDNAPHCIPFPTLATTTLFRLHQQQQQQKPIFPHPHSLHYSPPTNLAISPLLLSPLACNLKSLQANQQPQQHYRPSSMSPNQFPAKPKLPMSPPTISIGHYHPTIQQLHQQHVQHQQQQPILTHLQFGNSSSTTSMQQHNNSGINGSSNNHNNNSNGNTSSNHLNTNNSNSNSSTNHIAGNGKRKRSWSRAVFSNLQRKGLEIQFQQQKYITKPDRRKLAARLNLTDAQVKVWFQNRRMKWRHTRENLKSGQEKQPASAEQQQQQGHLEKSPRDVQHEMDYSSDGSDCSMPIDDNEDDGEIDVVE